MTAYQEPGREPGVADMVGEAAPPRDNGELVFEAPWEGRAFGIAVALRDLGLCQWRDFWEHLVAEIAGAQAHPQNEAGRPGYYEQWLGALEKLAIGKGFVSREELDLRTQGYASESHEDLDS